MPPRVFFFLRKSSCSILPLHTRKGLSSCTAHLSSYTGDSLGQSPTWPNSQLSTAGAHSLCGFTNHFVLIPLPVTSSNQVSLRLIKPCVAGEGAVSSALSQESWGRTSGVGLGLQSPRSPQWFQRPFCPEAIPLPSVFSVSSILFGLLSS